MHIADARAFEFPDSLLYFLKKSEAFATEVSFDSLINLIGNFMPQNDLDGQFEDESKKPKKAKKWGFSYFAPRPDDKPTFLDAYLSEIAKRMQKKKFGLEDKNMDDLLNSVLEDELIEDKPQEAYEEMVNLYRAGDLGKMRNFLLKHGDLLDSVMVRRNNEMLYSMETIMPKYSLFAVVGAAHLFDEIGLISLLKKQGYKVRRVQPFFSNKSLVDIPESITTDWYNLAQEESGFKMKFPSKPILIEDEGKFRYWLYPDIATGIYYFGFNLLIPQERNDALTTNSLQTIIEKLLKESYNAEIIEIKPIEFKGFKAVEALCKNPANDFEYIKIQGFINGNQLLIAMVGTIQNKLNVTDIDEFFSSIELFPLKQDFSFQKFARSNGSFSFYSFGKPTYITRKVKISEDSTIREQEVHAFATQVPYDKQVYVIRYSDMPIGYQVENDSIIFTEVVKLFQSKLDSSNYTTRQIELFSYKGYEHVITAYPDGSQILIRTYLRGSRLYLQFKVMSDYAKDTSIFNQFKFEPYEPYNYPKSILLDNDFRINLPAGGIKKIDNLSREDNILFERNFNYTTTDAKTGAIIIVNKYDFKPYAEMANLDSLFSFFEQSFKSNNYKIIQAKDGFYQNLPIKDNLLSMPKTESLAQTRLILRGKQLFILETNIAKEMREGNKLADFYNSLKFEQPIDQEFNLFKSKLPLILTDLTSNDSLTRENAKYALKYYDLKKSQLDTFYLAFDLNYTDDTSSAYLRTKTLLINHLEVLKLPETTGFLKKLYKRPEYKEEHNAILSALANIQTTEAWDAFVELAQNTEFTTEKTPNSYTFAKLLSDSTQFAQRYYPILLNESSKNLFFKHLWLNLHFNLQRDTTQRFDWLTQYDSQIILEAQKDIQKLKNQSQDVDNELNYQTISFYSQILDKMKPSPELEGVLQGFVQNTQQFQRQGFLRLLLKKDYLIDNYWVEELLKDTLSYLSTIELLMEHKKLDLASAKYLLSARVAQQMIRDYLEEDWGTNYELKQIEQRQVEINKQKAKLFVYKISSDFVDEDGKVENRDFLAIAGPLYEKKKKVFNFNYNLTSIDYDLIPNKANIDAKIKELLEYLEKRKVNEE